MNDSATRSTPPRAATEETAPVAQLPYEKIGGASAVRALVERFYDLMEHDPAYAALRAMHAPDLKPMRASLAGFLTAWLGGPRDWFEANPGKCMMSAHRALDIGSDQARQWVEAMGRALADTAVPADLAARMAELFARMAEGMRRH